MKTLCLVLLAIVALSIKIPTRANQEQCMVVFSYSNEESIKLHLRLPKAIDQKDTEFWYVTIQNTETFEKDTKEIPHGHFRQEISTSQSTLYNICFMFVGGRIEDFLVGYEASIDFRIQSEKIVIPESLSKTKDVRKTYKEAEKMIEFGDRFLEVQNKRSQTQDDLFIRTAAVGQTLITLLRVQLLVLVILMAYQVMAFRKWVKQRI